ncbi:MAG: hypothetical protein AVDCRST_MAG41-2674, partial [uncultured Corynebacteriales bacterium]
ERDPDGGAAGVPVADPGRAVALAGRRLVPGAARGDAAGPLGGRPGEPGRRPGGAADPRRGHVRRGDAGGAGAGPAGHPGAGRPVGQRRPGARHAGDPAGHPAVGGRDRAGQAARVLGHRAGVPRGDAAAGAVVLPRGRPVGAPDRGGLPGDRAAAGHRLRDLAGAVHAAGPHHHLGGAGLPDGVRADRRHAGHLRAGHRERADRGDGPQRRLRRLVRDHRAPAGQDLVPAGAEPVRGARRLGPGRPGADHRAAQRRHDRGAAQRRRARLDVPRAAPHPGGPALPRHRVRHPVRRAGRGDRRPGVAAGPGGEPAAGGRRDLGDDRPAAHPDPQARPRAAHRL